MSESGSVKVLCKYFLNREICVNRYDVFDCSKIFNNGCSNPDYIDWTTYLINKEYVIEVK